MASAAAQPSIKEAMQKSFAAPYSATNPVQLRLRSLVNQYLLGTRQPASTLEEPTFKRLLAGFDPRFVLYSRLTFKNDDVPAMVEDIKQRLKRSLAAAYGLSLTLDGWTSDGVPFLGITAHYISADGPLSISLKSSVLGLQHFPESHTSQNIEALVAKVLHEFLPEWDKKNAVFCVTTDSASNMVCYGRNDSHTYTWTRCFAHLLNLAVMDFLAQVDASDIIVKLRDLRTKFKHEKKFKSKYAEAVQDGSTFRKLKRDVATRWNSTLHMMKRALQQRSTITIALARLDSDELNLNDMEWKLCDALVRILEPFHLATEEVSSQTRVTISLPKMLLEHRLHSLMPGAEGEQMESYKKKMHDCLKVRKAEYDLDGAVATLGTILDPRFKSADLHATHRALLEQAVLQIAPTLPATAGPVSVSSEQDKRTATLFGDLHVTKQVLVQSDEVQSFIYETGIPYKEDPLAWWFQRKDRWPKLFAVAMRVLSAQATEVPSERLFSGAGRVFTDSRKSMHPNTVAQHVFIACNHPQLVLDRAQAAAKSSSESE